MASIIQRIHGSRNYKWLVFWTVAMALFVMVMDASVTFLALPSIASDFRSDLRSVTWVALASSLVVTALLLPAGRLADITGRKPFYIAAMVLFFVGAILATFAPNLQLLIGARVVMAIGGAMAQAIVLAIVTSVFPDRERGKALGMITTAVSIGATVGPIIAGPIIEVFSWRAVFIAMSIPTFVAIIVALLVLNDKKIGSLTKSESSNRAKFDWRGALFSAAALAMLVLVLANPFGWNAIYLTIGGLGTIALFIAFVWWQRVSPAPLFNVFLFRNLTFTYVNLVRLFGFMGNSAQFFLMPIFLQSFLGLSPTQTAILIFINAFGIGASAQFSGRLSDRIGTRVLTSAGLSGLVALNLAFAFINAETGTLLLGGMLLLHGLFMGTWMPPNMSATLGTVQRSSYGSVSAFVNLVRNVGSVSSQAIAAAVISSIMFAALGVEIELSAIDPSASPQIRAAFLSGWQVTFFIMMIFTALALVFAVITGSRRPIPAQVQPEIGQPATTHFSPADANDKTP